ncbi:MAG: uracil-DNA glycosylase family protein [Cyanobacteriota/Melainabacteria group bacterium]
MTEKLTLEKKETLIKSHVKELNACKLCPLMVGPVVSHHAMLSKVMLVGQAPGPKEGEFGKPFAWTAGKTLFRWFASIGVDEELFRKRAYMAAVCRCFPGKTKHGGDRVPLKKRWLVALNGLKRVRATRSRSGHSGRGRLAIDQFIDYSKLTDVIGKVHKVEVEGRKRDFIPLPHPSGASTWFKKDPGKTLTEDALKLLQEHEQWRKIFESES